ncbi:MAG: anti-sigma factor domain-containing protein [Gaiellaceae bacterium]
MSFEELLGGDDLTREEEARLRRVHELLLQAGPPPDLSPELERPPVPAEEADPPEVAYLLRRRRGLTAVLALAAALAAFVGGYAFGHTKAKPAAFATSRTVSMHGAAGTHGVVRVGISDSVGNWPMLVEVSGLPEQTNRRAYYELWLTHDGKPVAPCGSFRVHGKTTRVRLTVPYKLKGYDGWVVTTQPAEVHTPGRVVLTT